MAVLVVSCPARRKLYKPKSMTDVNDSVLDLRWDFYNTRTLISIYTDLSMDMYSRPMTSASVILWSSGISVAMFALMRSVKRSRFCKSLRSTLWCFPAAACKTKAF